MWGAMLIVVGSRTDFSCAGTSCEWAVWDAEEVSIGKPPSARTSVSLLPRQLTLDTPHQFAMIDALWQKRGKNYGFTWAKISGKLVAVFLDCHFGAKATHKAILA